MKGKRKKEQEIGSSQIREWIKNDKAYRLQYFEHDFTSFFTYHWGWDLKEFHENWLQSMEDGYNVLLKWFRSSRKTTIARGYAVWCICYQKHDYIAVQSFEDTLSWAWVHQVAKMLLEDSIINDYGILFPLETKREDLAKKSVSNFESTNGVKIESKSLGQTLRWANVYKRWKWAKRPTLLFLDDIDVEKSVKNIDIIDDNERKISGETIGSLDAKKRQIIFLGNVINEDGIVPRFVKKYKGKKSWHVYEQPLIYEDGRNAWPEEFTEDIIEKILEDEGQTSFNQNYKLIPYVDGQSIIPRSLIKTTDRYPTWCRITIGIDPAFSLKTQSDAIGICVTAHLNGNKYVLAFYELLATQKQEKVYRPFIKQVYNTFGVIRIRIENNNGGEIIGRQLQEDGMAVDIITTTKDKVTRLKEKESCFTRWEVYFLPWTEELQDRIVRFPNVKRDDIVDWFVLSLDDVADIFIGWL